MLLSPSGLSIALPSSHPLQGLIMNYFHHFYPKPPQGPGVPREFITPIIKVGMEWRAWRMGGVELLP